MTLEQQLSDLLDKHDINSISLSYSDYTGNGRLFSAYVHGDANGRRECVSGEHTKTAGQAISNSIALLLAKRGGEPLELAAMDEAA